MKEIIRLQDTTERRTEEDRLEEERLKKKFQEFVDKKEFKELVDLASRRVQRQREPTGVVENVQQVAEDIVDTAVRGVTGAVDFIKGIFNK